MFSDESVRIENAEAVQIVSFDGSDITEQCGLSGDIPNVILTASMEVAVTISHIRLKSPSSSLWPGVRLGDRERIALVNGGEVGIDARIRSHQG